MSLQSATGYVRLSMNTGFDDKSMTVNWMCFHNSNWTENNPRRVWQGIVEVGSNRFDLSIKEIQTNEEGDDIEVITGYLPQSMDTAHELLKNLTGKDCNFNGVNFQIVP